MVLRPIFADGRIRWFGGTLIHVADMGGTAVGGLGALATSTYDEGVLLPTVRLYEEGRPNRDVLSIIARNSRVPGKVIGDIQALVAGVNVIARRVEELADRYGADVLAQHMDDYLDYAERRLRDELRQIPPGSYRGSFTVDSDGVAPGRTFEVVATVTLGEGEATVDFTGTAPQSGGAINASFSQTLSGVIYAIRCLVDPSIPMNEGCFRLIHTVLPAGLAGQPRPSRGMRGPDGHGGGSGGGHSGRPGRRPARAGGGRQRAHPRVHPLGRRIRPGSGGSSSATSSAASAPAAAWTGPTPPAPTSSVGARSSPRSSRWKPSCRFWSNGAG